MIAHLDITSFSSACVSALASAACWVDGRLALYLRFGRGSPGSSRDHLFVRDALAYYSVDERIKPLKRVPLNVALVQSESEFVNVAVKVLRARVVVDAIQSALQDSPNALDAVRVRRAPRILTRAVVDGIVAEEQAVQVAVCAMLIGVEVRPDFHRAVNLVLDRAQVRGLDDLRDRAATAFAHSEDGSLADRPAPRLQFFVLVLVCFFPADEAFVNLDYAPQFVDIGIVSACLAQALQHEPCRLLSYADL